eukprot:TRINITY_DN12916_c0_g1_i1.p1 TRINITY_DN12916_c0_g1~~TRINITY_DN12916_c0_g1_i1.p1  ORF type:complete len:210 (+),score=46.14 TRINITY_DN12916_c0_g1_i1:43-672(+)
MKSLTRATIVFSAIFALLCCASGCWGQDCVDLSKVQQVEDSDDMNAVTGNVTVAIPLEVLWTFFTTQVSSWNLWNSAIDSSGPNELVLCQEFNIDFNPFETSLPFDIPSSDLPYNLTLTDSVGTVWWTYSGPLLFGVHQQTFYDNGDNTTTYESYEKAMGGAIEIASSLWFDQFQFVADSSTQGLECLEQVYINTNGLDLNDVASTCSH